MLRVFEAFAGVGSQRQALKNIGIEHEVVGISEIDKQSIKTYNALHGETYNVGDISNIDISKVPDHDLLTYSFPCQDISKSGGWKGFREGSNTNSSLLWECKRIIENKKPKYLLLENVQNLVSKRYIGDFELWIEFLSSLGYNTKWKIINSCNHGIPQARERVFAVSILDNDNFEFPKDRKLEYLLADFLDDEVNEKYYADEYTREYVVNQIKSTDYSIFKGIKTYNVKFPTAVRKHDVDCETLPLLLKKAKKNAKVTTQYIADKFEISKSKADHWFRKGDGFVPPNREHWYQLKEIIQFDNNEYDNQIMDFEYKDILYNHLNRVQDISGLCPTLTVKIQPNILVDNNIRKLTPNEYIKLMGFGDSEREIINSLGYSDFAIYKQFGNSIVVPVLEDIFKEMFKA